jgi:hypothetical protein
MYEYSAHKEGGRTFTKAMKACYEYKDWVHLSNTDKRLVVKGALERMIISKMLICKKDDLGTIQYYLGNLGMTLLGRTEHPDINNRPDKFLPSIIIRTRDGMKIVNKRRDTTTSKQTAVDHPAKVTPPAKKLRKLPKQTVSSSSEDDNDGNDDEEDKNEENDDVGNGNNQSKVGHVNDQNNHIPYI